MKLKQWVKYLVYIAVIYFALVLRAHLAFLLRQYVEQTYRYDKDFLYLPLITLITMFIGALLGLDYILAHRKKAGKWHVNWPKLILLGVPSLALSLFSFAFSTPFFTNFINALFPLYGWLLYDGSFVVVFQLILGYAIMTSFYKKEPVSKAEPATAQDGLASVS